MILKINPRDVVSIPSDYNNSKGRTCRYEVIDELAVDPNEAFTRSIQNSANGSDLYEDEDDWFDDDEDSFIDDNYGH
jgi:hypothetical protein